MHMLLTLHSISSLLSIFRVGSTLIEGLVFGRIEHVITTSQIREINGVYRVNVKEDVKL